MRKPEPAISRVLSSTTIHLGQSSPTASSNLPGSPLGTGGAHKRYSPIWSCSRRGLPCRELLPVARCALTAPFHPYRQAGGIFSVALSMGSRPPGGTWRLVRRSPDFPLQGRGTHSDCLANSGFLDYRFYSKIYCNMDATGTPRSFAAFGCKAARPQGELKSFPACLTPIAAYTVNSASGRSLGPGLLRLPCPVTSPITRQAIGQHREMTWLALGNRQ